MTSNENSPGGFAWNEIPHIVTDEPPQWPATDARGRFVKDVLDGFSILKHSVVDDESDTFQEGVEAAARYLKHKASRWGVEV